MKTWPSKDPDDVLDYYVKWGLRLVESDQIVASTWTVPTGITKDSDGIVNYLDDAGVLHTNGASQIWISGGTLEEVYIFVNHVTTVGGRQMDQSVKIRIKAK